MKMLELREKRMQLVKQAQDILTRSVDGVKPEDRAQFDALMKEADDILGDVQRAEKVEQESRDIEAAYRPTSAKPDPRDSGDDSEKRVAEAHKAESRAFSAYLRGGVAALKGEDRAIMEKRFETRALAEGTGSTGGFLVPQDFYRKLTEALKFFGGMRQAATILQTADGATMPFPTVNDTSNLGAILGENAQATEQDTTFASVSLGAYTYTSKIVQVPLNLVQDSAFDLDSYLAKALGVRIGRIQNAHFTVGTGGGTQPNGIVTAATSGAVGATGQTLTIKYVDLVALEHSVDPAYRAMPSTKWMFADSSLKVIKEIVDGNGRPLWKAGLEGMGERFPDTLNGYPYIINQDVPAMAANAKSVLFGDFSNYMIRDVLGVQIMRLTERYADFFQVGYVAFARADGNLIDAGTHPVTYYANSAT